MPAGLVLAGCGAVIGGMLVAAQSPIYARLSEGLNRDPLASVFIAFLSATLVTGLLTLVLGNWRSLSAAGLAALPSWVWLGGLLGACHVMISMQAIPLIGVSVFLVLVIAGNLIGAAIYDHFGALGLVPRPFTMLCLAGLTLVLIGVLVTTKP